MKVAVLKESVAGERRVAAVPATVEKMVGAGLEVLVERGAGIASGFADAEFETAGAKTAERPEEQLAGGDLVVRVQRPSEKELDRLPQGVILVAYSLQARGEQWLADRWKSRKISALSLDLLPRIARAQSIRSSRISMSIPTTCSRPSRWLAEGCPRASAATFSTWPTPTSSSGGRR